MRPVVIRWKRDAARVPAACVLMLVVLVGAALMRMSVKERLTEQRAAAAALAAHSGSRIAGAIALATEPGLCASDASTLEPMIRAVDAGRIARSGFHYELSCTPAGGGRPRLVARSAERGLSDPVLHFSHGRTSVWTTALAPQVGWVQWRVIALQTVLVFVTALFAMLAITALARRPELLRRELRVRDGRLKAVHQRLVKEIHQREALESQISQATLPDALTALSNRGYFIDRLERAQQRARHDPAAGIAVLVISLDRFPPIDDRRWISAGDALMLQAVRRLEQCLGAREHAIARVADDALGVLLIGVASRESARAEAGLLHQALAAAFTIGGQLVFVNPNMGIALAASGNEGAEQLLRGAHLAMQRAIDNYRAATEKFVARRPRRAALAGESVSVLSA